VLWIRIVFNTDPDRAFYLRADPDLARGHTLPSLKVDFLHENIL
jgi:hypothetical protein